MVKGNDLEDTETKRTGPSPRSLISVDTSENCSLGVYEAFCNDLLRDLMC